VDEDRCRSSTVQFESADPYNRWDRIQVVKLVCWQLLSTTALLSYKVALDKEDDRVA